MVNTIGTLRRQAKRLQELGVKPEIEVFDTGHLLMVNDLVKEGLINGPPLVQLCMGVSYGGPPDLMTLQALVHQHPPGAVYSTFSVGGMQLPYAAFGSNHQRASSCSERPRFSIARECA
ncbi:3-keto-5-aminohexanoate cleavage protein [Bradyrhizobium yuanmingense]|uniref:3-keto-5-aminohexanoate cleavage protein n=1 Tax=Bradyrhizobium yuanmingense TaxID=108015 RepID=UPI0023B98651|nr:3-keto-5-aminohexanoate cleavage protein [Bradyrhizobium yuanmingense]MDF0498874.1 3-keto-5-aminohexanoate cleavage protein [Bradyrhizobium yuanmingense]